MDEAKFVAALTRKFRAHEVEPRELPPPPPRTPSTPRPEPRRCHLCQRSLGTRLVENNGLLWCPDTEADKCLRIAAGRLGASASNANRDSSLKGQLEPSGTCRDCGAEVLWVKTQRGKKMPVDVIPAPKDVAAFELVGKSDTMAFYVSERRRASHWGDVYESHFQTCKNGRHR